MILKKLLEKLEYQVVSGDDAVEINHLQNDSRKVEKGDVFVCIQGAGFDGHEFVTDVTQKGAAAIIVMEEVTVPEGVTVILVKNTRYALACMSAAYFDYPAEKLTTIGITGTKGKTTTTYMVRQVLERVGIKTGLIGTIETIIGDEVIPSKNTTPESYIVSPVEVYVLMPSAQKLHPWTVRTGKSEASLCFVQPYILPIAAHPIVPLLQK